MQASARGFPAQGCSALQAVRVNCYEYDSIERRVYEGGYTPALPAVRVMSIGSQAMSESRGTSGQTSWQRRRCRRLALVSRRWRTGGGA